MRSDHPIYLLLAVGACILTVVVIDGPIARLFFIGLGIALVYTLVKPLFKKEE